MGRVNAGVKVGRNTCHYVAILTVARHGKDSGIDLGIEDKTDASRFQDAVLIPDVHLLKNGEKRKLRAIPTLIRLYAVNDFPDIVQNRGGNTVELAFDVGVVPLLEEREAGASLSL